MPSAAIRSPRIAGTRKRCFWSSVPNFQIGGVAMPMCAPIPAERPPEPRAGELLAEHRVVQVVAALAAVLLRVLEPEVAELGHAREHLVREPLRVLPLGGVGAQLACATKRLIASRRSSCSSVNGGSGRRWAAAGSPLSASVTAASSACRRPRASPGARATSPGGSFRNLPERLAPRPRPGTAPSRAAAWRLLLLGAASSGSACSIRAASFSRALSDSTRWPYFANSGEASATPFTSSAGPRREAGARSLVCTTGVGTPFVGAASSRPPRRCPST